MEGLAPQIWPNVEMPGTVGGHAQTTLTWVYSNWEEFSQKSDMAGWNTCSAQGKSSTNGTLWLCQQFAIENGPVEIVFLYLLIAWWILKNR